MIEEIEEYLRDFEGELAQVLTRDDLNRVKGKYAGRKSRIPLFLERLKTLPLEERRIVGRRLNEVKAFIEERLRKKEAELSQKERRRESVDLSLPGRRHPVGAFHPLRLVMDEIVAIFRSLGFRVEEGPEIETELYNFEALNIPADHPARDAQDSFYLGGGFLLRTHTSPAQIRVMEKLTPPFRVIVPGRCYRRDAFDATHSPVFHQIEGLVVAPGISMGDLKGTVEVFARRLFGERRQVRFRPSYFPFTEPSAEVDISCGICQGAGCRSCGGQGWLEIMGAGLVHPQVFRNVGYDPEKVQGFAFGMGVERIAMLKFGIPDIRWFFENDVVFLSAFKGLG
ncbi:phenylalanine--tRNA ligase subunit alpha [Candidatus Caldatribacterium saccharofermentans]|uniref:Phenylalanine--tRNA ligase alpha subunit n=1 Tax=Candidatus Caldatribacterium saccharofermentans TaxID=1454753 RepID=A0A7V4WL72_9BACT